MNALRIAVCAALLVTGAADSAYGQQNNKASQASTPSSGDQVEVKTDRFSEATTIKLAPQTILDTPDQLITMRLEAKFGDKEIRDTTDQVIEILDEKAMVWFESFANVPTDFGDQELHFLIESKPLKVGKSAGGTPSQSPKPTYRSLKIFVNSLDTDELKQLAAGKQVEMRLGKYEFTLSAAALEHLREFVRQFIKYAPSSKLKGR